MKTSGYSATAAKKQPRKCGSCGGYCGGRRGSCKFAANQAKQRADEMWAFTVGAHERKAP